MRWLGPLPVLALALVAGASRAHELRPAYLQLREVAPGAYDVLWKVPALADGRRLGLSLRLPDRCRSAPGPPAVVAGGAWIERTRIRCPRLAGGEIRVEGLSATRTDALARIERADGATQTARMTADRPSFVVAAAPDAMQVVRTYVSLGLEHILAGVDHLLFVLALLLLVRGVPRLVKTVSAFTIAHGVTLGLATLGLVRAPPAPVETAIALSIVFAAREVVKRRTAPPTLAQRRPWIMAFVFGLLHGLGFAGGLSAAGLPAGHVPLALLFFSAGVEIGHFAFVAVVLSMLAAARRLRFQPPAWAPGLPGYAIGGLASSWTIERVLALW